MFPDSYVIYMCVMNILCLFHISVLWVCYITRYFLKNWFEGVFLLKYWAWIKCFPKVTPLELTLDYYVLLGTICFTNEENNFIRVTNLCDRRLTVPNITAQLNQCCENVSTSTVRRILCEAGLYDRITAKKPLLRKQNNVKRMQWVKAHNRAVFWTDEWKF